MLDLTNDTSPPVYNDTGRGHMGNNHADEQYYLDLTHEEEDGDEDGIVATCVRFSKKRKRPHVSFGIANASGHLEPGDIIEVDSGESSPTLVANGSISSSGAVMDLTDSQEVFVLEEHASVLCEKDVCCKLRSMFPDADSEWMQTKVKGFVASWHDRSPGLPWDAAKESSGADIFEQLFLLAVDDFLQNGVERRADFASSSSRLMGDLNPPTMDFTEANPYELRPGSPPASKTYARACLHQLCADFRNVATSDLAQAMECHKQRYGPTKKAVQGELEKLLTEGKGCTSSSRHGGSSAQKHHKGKGKAKAKQQPKPAEGSDAGSTAWTGLKEPLLHKLRKVTRNPLKNTRLTAEIAAVVQLEEETHHQKTADAAREAMDLQAQADGTSQECGCCYMDYSPSSMVPCQAGHTFCVGCVRRQVQETVFGIASNVVCIPCMSTCGCKSTFQFSKVREVLPRDLLRCYEKRQEDDALLKAALPGLVSCPHCNLRVEVPEEQRILRCPRESCGRETCKLCGEPPHIPLRCEEVEKTNAAVARLTIEERMSQAMVRTCGKCKASLIKEEGCNKVTCPRCGQIMCYLCRKKIEDYSHFCQHALAPDTKCTACIKCSLWTTAKEDDAQAVREAKEAALQEQLELDPTAIQLDRRPIGPSEEPKHASGGAKA